MPERPPVPYVCTAVVVERGGKLLLLRRSPGCWAWPGHWCLPGGRLEPGETLAECCARELREETGLVVVPPRLTLVGLTETPGPPHLVGLVYRVRPPVAAEPINAEPDRHDALDWFRWGALPAPLMPGVRQFIEAVARFDFVSVAVGRPT